MEKKLSLNYEEATALLQMSLFSYLDDSSEAADSALEKLGEICRQFPVHDGNVGIEPVSCEFARTA